MDPRKKTTVIEGYRRFEKIYDRCAYKGCTNGKSTGHHLFKFPAAKDPRQPIWIRHSSGSDDQLRSWSASTLRRAGICRSHFAPESFVIGNDAKLTRHAVPLSLDGKKDVTMSRDKIVKRPLKKANILLHVKKGNFVSSANCNENSIFHKSTDVSGVVTFKNVPEKKSNPEKLESLSRHNAVRKRVVSPAGKSNILPSSIVKVRTKDILAKAIDRIAELQRANIALKRQNDLLQQQVQL